MFRKEAEEAGKDIFKGLGIGREERSVEDVNERPREGRSEDYVNFVRYPIKACSSATAIIVDVALDLRDGQETVFIRTLCCRDKVGGESAGDGLQEGGGSVGVSSF